MVYTSAVPMQTVINVLRNLALMAKPKVSKADDGSYEKVVKDVVAQLLSNGDFIKMLTSASTAQTVAPSNADAKAVLKEHSIEPTESHKMAFNISKEDFRMLSKEGYTMKTAIVSIKKRE